MILRANPTSRQRGITALGAVAILVVVASIVTVALRLGPHYVDFYTMQTLIEELPANRVHTMARGDIREALQKRFRINNIRAYKVSDVISIERGKGETQLIIRYEAREHLVSNVDAVMRFEKTYRFQ